MRDRAHRGAVDVQGDRPGDGAMDPGETGPGPGDRLGTGVAWSTFQSGPSAFAQAETVKRRRVSTTGPGAVTVPETPSSSSAPPCPVLHNAPGDGVPVSPSEPPDAVPFIRQSRPGQPCVEPYTGAWSEVPVGVRTGGVAMVLQEGWAARV
ncbi:hypothetical protein ACIOHH_13840 [Streptomyces microflavus]|uniref:hypothetical protein n=1 Tax=Streptomyces microflavus TaxID=1919 RepID=UPI00382FE6ED